MSNYPIKAHWKVNLKVPEENQRKKNQRPPLPLISRENQLTKKYKEPQDKDKDRGRDRSRRKVFPGKEWLSHQENKAQIQH